MAKPLRGGARSEVFGLLGCVVERVIGNNIYFSLSLLLPNLEVRDFAPP
jgi:hypothetical protein